MSYKKPLMPKATAIWLIENTALTFRQIAKFCNLHELEVKAMADRDIYFNIIGISPLQNGQLSQDQIDQCTKNPDLDLAIEQKYKFQIAAKLSKSKSKAKYTPVIRRQDKPSAILWLLNKFPQIEDKKIIKLIGTTKNTVLSVKNQEHWNINNIKPQDPVVLGLCSQSELLALEKELDNK